MVEDTAEDAGRERQKLDTHGNVPVVYTREGVGEMLSDRPERTTHKILEDARVAVGQWKI